jgi:uncharacterized protein YbbC (DUF1343 family)
MKRKIISIIILMIFPAFFSIAGTMNGKVTLGDERYGTYLPLLKDSRIAVFSNSPGIVGDKINGTEAGGNHGKKIKDPGLVPFGENAYGEKLIYGQHIVDFLLSKKINVTAIFSPEHGFRGMADAGEKIKSSIDKKTGVPILSLYSNGTNIPSREDMDKFDILVIDIQDVGLRYYTYYITMYHLMDACAMFGKKVVLLDRPNPNGFYVDGPILDMKYTSGIGLLPIPIVHGMTLGELALMINGEKWLPKGRKCELTVIPCLDYTHKTKYSLIVAPSPNLKDMKSIYLYASTCFFEGTVVTPGRGTNFPFEVYGHPDMKGCDFSFTPKNIPGATDPRYKDTECFGRDLRVKTNASICRKGINMAYVIDAYNNLDMGDKFFKDGNHFELRTGNISVRKMIEEGKSPKEIKASWKQEIKKFKKEREKYLLYPE